MIKRGWILTMAAAVMMAMASRHAVAEPVIELKTGVTLGRNVTFKVPPSFCSVDGDKNTNTTIEGDVVYCDNSLKLWTPTAVIGGVATTKTWGPDDEDEGDDSCIGKGSDYPACYYCDGLDYAGYDNWVLPSCTSTVQGTGCQLYMFGIDACGSYPCTPAWDTNAQGANPAYYWSS